MKLFKRIFITVMSAIMLFSACLGLTACGTTTKLELQVEVYDYSEEEVKEFTITVELYSHLAPKTVKAVVDAVKNGYYDNAVFYSIQNYNSQIMVGDYKVNEDGEIVFNEKLPTIDGEFERNGVVGSNLTNVKGSIGIWRSWYASDEEYRTSSDARDSGSLNWYMPTVKLSGYDKYFCVFATIDMENETNADAFQMILDATKADTFDQYMVYYTGEYDAEKGAEEDYGLTAHIVKYADYDEALIDDLFVAEDAQLVKYNAHYIKVSEPEQGSKNVGAKIVKATIK